MTLARPQVAVEFLVNDGGHGRWPFVLEFDLMKREIGLLCFRPMLLFHARVSRLFLLFRSDTVNISDLKDFTRAFRGVKQL